MADIVNMIVEALITKLSTDIATIGYCDRWPMDQDVERLADAIFVCPNDPDDETWRHELDETRDMMGQTVRPWKRKFSIEVRKIAKSTNKQAAARGLGTIIRQVEQTVLGTTWAIGPDDHGESVWQACRVGVETYEKITGGEDEFSMRGKVRVVFLTGG